MTSSRALRFFAHWYNEICYTVCRHYGQMKSPNSKWNIPVNFLKNKNSSTTKLWTKSPRNGITSTNNWALDWGRRDESWMPGWRKDLLCWENGIPPLPSSCFMYHINSFVRRIAAPKKAFLLCTTFSARTWRLKKNKAPEIGRRREGRATTEARLKRTEERRGRHVAYPSSSAVRDAAR